MIPRRGDRRARGLTLLACLCLVLGEPRFLGAADAPAPGPSAAVEERLLASDRAAQDGRLEQAEAGYAAAAGLARDAKDLPGEIRAQRGRVRVLERLRDATRLGEATAALARALEESGEGAEARRAISDLSVRLLLELGRPADALGVATRLLAQADAAHDEEVAATAEQVRALALEDLLDPGRAISAAERAVERARKLGGAEEVARALETLAGILTGIGAVDRAESLHGEVFRILGPEDSGIRADALGNLGILLYHSRGDPERALPPLLESTAIHERMGNRSSAALGHLHLGRARLLMGDTVEAGKAVDAALRASTADDLLSAYGWLLRADIRLRDGAEPAAALEACERALEFSTRVDSIGLELEHGRVHAEALLAAGDATAAVAEVRRAIEIAEKIDLGLPDEEAAQARDRLGAVFQVGVRAAVATGAPERIAEFLERGRAGALLSGLGRRDAVFAAVASEKVRRAEREARERVVERDRALRAASDSGLRPRIREARAARDAAYQEYVAATDAAEREARLTTPGSRLAVSALARIQGGLEASDALVLYTVATDPPGALVVRRGEARWVPLKPRAEIERLLGWADLSASEESATEDLENLRAALAKPLGLPKGVRRILVSPEGPLCTVPFSAIFAAEKADVALVPSGSVLLWLRTDAPRRGKGVLAVGDPDYTIPRDPGSVEVFGPPTVARLPGTEAEIRRIANGGEDLVLVGRSASERRVREAAGARVRWSLAYFACHGQVDANRPSRSALVLSPDREDDGFLAVHEVFRARLSADLVVLAACESALGGVLTGEGLYGLPRAFLCAGSPRVIGSLWRVDDEATRELMLALTDAWKKGVGAATALRLAQETVRTTPRWSHPRYWAPWVLWGIPD